MKDCRRRSVILAYWPIDCSAARIVVLNDMLIFVVATIDSYLQGQKIVLYILISKDFLFKISLRMGSERTLAGSCIPPIQIPRWHPCQHLW
mgnify:CR=1 FL=1